MVLEVLWHAEIGWQSLQYSLAGWSSYYTGNFSQLDIASLFRFGNGRRAVRCCWPRLFRMSPTWGCRCWSKFWRLVTFRGYSNRFVCRRAIGVFHRHHVGPLYGIDDDGDGQNRLMAFFNAPPFWAAFLAVVLNLNQVFAPFGCAGLLQKCAAAVAPLMIFSLGMALSWRAVHYRNLPYILPVD